MRLTVLGVVVCCLLTVGLPHAAAQDHLELFGGYSYVRGSVPATTAILCPAGTCPLATVTYHPNLNGWELAGTIRPGTTFGITADFSGHYGSIGGASTHLQTYLFGPKLAFPGPISPFAHVLIGAAHQSVGNGSTSQGIVFGSEHTGVALALGAGIDIHWLPFIAIRLIQIDYLLTRLKGNTESQPRVSAGLVLRF